MKPEELDELFRHGLAGQSAPPSGRAWDLVQQRLRETPATDEADELPAFLRGGSPPLAAKPPMMTASRGGAAGSLSSSWTQRPLWRAAAVAILALGSALAYQHQVASTTAAPEGPAVAAVAPARPLRSISNQPKQAAPLENVSELAAGLAATATSAPSLTSRAISSTVADAPATPAPASTTTDPNAAIDRSAFERTGDNVALASLDVTEALIGEHLHCQDGSCTECEAIEQKIGHAKFYQLRAEAANALVARVKEERRAPAATPGTGFALASTRPAARRPAPHRTAPVAVPNSDAPEALCTEAAAPTETVIATSGDWELVIRPVAPAPPAEPATNSQTACRHPNQSVTSPNDVLRRAGDHLRTLLDRADRTRDGRLTIDTEVAGRPVRKTISL